MAMARPDCTPLEKGTNPPQDSSPLRKGTKRQRSLDFEDDGLQHDISPRSLVRPKMVPGDGSGSAERGILNSI